MFVVGFLRVDFFLLSLLSVLHKGNEVILNWSICLMPSKDCSTVQKRVEITCLLLTAKEEKIFNVIFSHCVLLLF